MSRFRTGDMPVGIANYTTYNTIVVAAPEIRNLWDFTYIPGTMDENGNIDRSNAAGGACTMMINNHNESVQLDAWEFMKWWVSADIQVRYGREMEALLGASARYATANVEALKQLSWNSEQIEILEDSLDQTIGVPEVPGSYYTPRHVVNAARKVVNEHEDPRETLIDYTRKINEELTRKRQEFNLPVAED